MTDIYRFQEELFKDHTLRITQNGKYVAVMDLIKVTAERDKPRTIWKRLLQDEDFETEIKPYLKYHTFARGKPSACVDVKGVCLLLYRLPGQKSNAFRSKSAGILIRHMGGDESLIHEIKRNKQIATENSKSPQAFFRQNMNNEPSSTNEYIALTINQDEPNDITVVTNVDSLKSDVMHIETNAHPMVRKWIDAVTNGDPSKLLQKLESVNRPDNRRGVIYKIEFANSNDRDKFLDHCKQNLSTKLYSSLNLSGSHLTFDTTSLANSLQMEHIPDTCDIYQAFLAVMVSMLETMHIAAKFKKLQKINVTNKKGTYLSRLEELIDVEADFIKQYLPPSYEELFGRKKTEMIPLKDISEDLKIEKYKALSKILDSSVSLSLKEQAAVQLLNI